MVSFSAVLSKEAKMIGKKKCLGARVRMFQAFATVLLLLLAHASAQAMYYRLAIREIGGGDIAPFGNNALKDVC